MKHLLGFIFIASVQAISAQTIERHVTASSGNSFSGTFQMDWTIGETVVTTGSVGSVLLNQGFHQMLYAAPSNAVKQVQNNIQFWPNPCESVLNLNSSINMSGSKIGIVNTTGARVAEFNWTGTDRFTADVSGLAQGTYLMVLENNPHRTVFKFSKI